jgi:Ca-activated chloride channel family protein
MEVTGLTERQITVLQDGEQVTGITSFSARHDDFALRMVLVLDTSESMRNRLAGEQRMAQDLLLRTLRPGRDQVSVVSFAANAHPIANRQAHLFAASIRRLRAAGQTALYDTLYETLQGISTQGSARPERRVIIIFSDGEDNWSRHTLDDVIMLAQHTDVVVYPITAHRSHLEYVGDRTLRRLADATGG